MNSSADSAPPIALNPSLSGLQPSATLAINESSAARQARGEQVFRFGLGQSPFPVPDSVRDALRDNAHQKDYLPVRGLAELRQAVAGYHQRSVDVPVQADDVLIGPGSKELMFILQLVRRATLLIPSPSWVSYAPQAAILGRPVQWVDTRREDAWRLQPEALDAACRDDPQQPRTLILNDPNNPAGHTYSPDQLQSLAEVARRWRVLIISDEIYSGVNHSGDHASIARYYPEGTIISGGLSKWCGAGGWRLGTFAIPEPLHALRDAMAVIASETFTSVSAPIQHAAIRGFAGGADIDDYLLRSRQVLAAVAGRCHAALSARAGCQVAEPQGGFYLFPDLSDHAVGLARHGIHDSATLCARILADTGVATLPGTCFGRPPAELTLRLAYVDFDGARALQAAAATAPDATLDEAFLQSCCPRVVAGIDRLADWIVSHR